MKGLLIKISLSAFILLLKASQPTTTQKTTKEAGKNPPSPQNSSDSKDFEIEILLNGMTVTDKYLACQDSTCSFSHQNFNLVNTLVIRWNQKAQKRTIQTLEMEKLLLHSNNDSEGAKLELDLPDITLRILQSSISCEVVSIYAKDILVFVTVFDYSNFFIHADNTIKFYSVESEPTGSLCSYYSTSFLLDLALRNGFVNCRPDFEPYMELRESIIKNLSKFLELKVNFLLKRLLFL